MKPELIKDFCHWLGTSLVVIVTIIIVWLATSFLWHTTYPVGEIYLPMLLLAPLALACVAAAPGRVLRYMCASRPRA